MTNDYELADDSREALIWTKEQLVAPLQPGMEEPPHPMRLGDTEEEYYALGAMLAASQQADAADSQDQGGEHGAGEHGASEHGASEHGAGEHGGLA
jgi:NADH-quinone oxidoreductase subunit I